MCSAVARIFGQSSTASRTSRSTRSRSAASTLVAGPRRCSRSISMCIHDSTRRRRRPLAPALDVSHTSSSVPVTSRRTTSCGWTTRWMARPCRLSSAVTESTRNGMSSADDLDDRCAPSAVQPSSLDGRGGAPGRWPCPAAGGGQLAVRERLRRATSSSRPRPRCPRPPRAGSSGAGRPRSPASVARAPPAALAASRSSSAAFSSLESYDRAQVVRHVRRHRRRRSRSGCSVARGGPPSRARARPRRPAFDQRRGAVGTRPADAARARHSCERSSQSSG